MTSGPEEREDSPLRLPVGPLDSDGLTVGTKPTKKFAEHAGRRPVKSDTDNGVTADMLEIVDLQGGIARATPPQSPISV